MSQSLAYTLRTVTFLRVAILLRVRCSAVQLGLVEVFGYHVYAREQCMSDACVCVCAAFA